MADVPTRLVIDASGPRRPSDEDLAAMEQDALELLKAGEGDKAVMVMAAVREAQQIPEKEQVVPLDADDLAQRDVDIADAEDQHARAQEAALAGLRAKRDRWLAQTDVLALPAAAYPVDMPQAVKDQIAANRQAWLDFRQALRQYPSTVTDPLSPPPFPAQPAAPNIILS